MAWGAGSNFDTAWRAQRRKSTQKQTSTYEEFLAKQKAAMEPPPAPLAPAPTTAASATTPGTPTPPDARLESLQAATAAKGAAARTRRRAAFGPPPAPRAPSAAPVLNSRRARSGY